MNPRDAARARGHRWHFVVGERTACGLPALRYNRPRGSTDSTETTCGTCRHTFAWYNVEGRRRIAEHHAAVSHGE